MTKATTLLALVVLILLPACNRNGKDKAGNSQATSSAPVVKPLSEGEIVGVMTATTEALVQADSTAAALIESPGINSYAVVLRSDHRAIAQEVRAVADTIKVVGASSPVADRLRAEAAAIVTTLADTTIERGPAFVDAQIEMQKHFIGAMDSLLIPAAKTPALRQVLQDLRPAIVAHLQRGEQLKQILATASTAAPRVAARISPDSARKPGDTLGVKLKVDSGSMATDTIR